jgi:hypothetical protein
MENMVSMGEKMSELSICFRMKKKDWRPFLILERRRVKIGSRVG